MKHRPTEKEVKEIAKSILVRKSDKPLRNCSEHPINKQLRDVFRFEKRPECQYISADLSI